MSNKYVYCFIKCIRVLLELLSSVFFRILYRESSKQLPPITNLLLLEPATSLAAKIRDQKVTSEEVVKAFINRIKVINPLLNCVVDERFNEALEEAKIVDEQLRCQNIDKSKIAKETPFLGVPFTTKDSFKVKGLRQTAGLYDRRFMVSDRDADAVSLYKKAGGIILCVTNTSELCMWWESNNTVNGRTNNPYDFNRTVGGSSGGEGCLLSSCGSALGIGSDIGGSIRMPSFFNGIFGHKPSSGVVSNDGQEPEAVGSLDKMLSVGPMSRHVADLRPALKVLAAGNVALLQLDTKVSMKSLRFFYVEDDGGSAFTTPVSRDLKAAMKFVVSHLSLAHDITAKKLRLKELKYIVPAYISALGSEKQAATFAQELALKKGAINTWRECLKFPAGLSKHTFPALSLCVVEKMNSEHDPRKQQLATIVQNLSAQLKDVLGDDGILLYPSHPTTAPYHNQPIFRPFNWAYTAVFNLLGFPVTQCPLGLNGQRLPLGIQVVGNLHQDHLCLSVAEELEKAFGGWVCPSVIE